MRYTHLWLYGFGTIFWTNLIRWTALQCFVKGAYCILAVLPERRSIRIGSLGKVELPAGVYVYVGSAMAGVEQRIKRHVRKDKKKRWHIDYLMQHAEYVSSFAIPSDTKAVECSVARTLERSEDIVSSVSRFGCSDCRCDSHLFYFGDSDPESIAETVSLRLSMLECVYPSKQGDKAWARRDRQ